MQRFYLFFRILLCPFDRLVKYIPDKGEILDLGCGNGAWFGYLSLLKKDLKKTGYEIDPVKLKSACSLIDCRTNIEKRDIGDKIKGLYDCISIIDVFYLISPEKQQSILKNCYEHLKPGGRIVIKELVMKPRWKFFISYFEEILAVRILNFTYGNRLYFKSSSYYVEMIKKIGFSEIKISELHKGYFAPHELISGIKQ